MKEPKPGRVIGTITPRRSLPELNVTRPRVWLAAPLRLVARPDQHTAEVVQRGLEIFQHFGQLEAIDFFALHGIPLRITSRVLWRPESRRGGQHD
jgi:hypothetical protein